MKALTLTIYIAEGGDDAEIIDAINATMLELVEEGHIHPDLTACPEPTAEDGELGWAWKGPQEVNP